MTGIAAVICNDSARYSLFWACWDQLDLPDGWRKERLIGGDWCGARNTLCELTLASDTDWLWFMDDDMTFQPDVIHRLLEWDVALVMPVCLTRSSPFAPVQFTERIGDDRYLPIYLPEQPSGGLVELVAGGTAGMLIHRDVLASVEPPWFEYGFASEDILFCNKAADQGFSLYADLSVRLGHITVAVVEPAVVDDEWAVGVRVGTTGQMTNVVLPIEHEQPAERASADAVRR